MNHEDQSTFKKNKIIPRWVQPTLLWKFMSNLKLALKRMFMSSFCWDWSRFFKYFNKGLDLRL